MGLALTVVAYLPARRSSSTAAMRSTPTAAIPTANTRRTWGAIAILVAGLLFAFNKVGNFGAQTVTGSSATATGANSQVLTIQ